MAAVAGTSSNTFFTSPVKGSGLRGIELDRAYQGETLNGKRHGYGVYTYPGGFFRYEGQYVNGQKHGIGALFMKDGALYEGQFDHDEIQGRGKKRFANGNVYVGPFVLGEMHGHGTMVLANGDVYEGPFVRNASQGTGRYVSANGDIYEGDFRRGKIAGKGVRLYANGDRYEGDWVDGQRMGHGECTYANGDCYTGDWAADRYHGQGVLTLQRQALRYEGKFVEGRPSTVPTKMNTFWFAPEDPKAKAKAAPAKPAAGKGATGPVVPTLPNVLGQQLPFTVVVAAQFQEPVPGEGEEDAAADGAGGETVQPAEAAAPPAKGGKAAAPPPVMVQAVTEPPDEGQRWRTASMEFGRVAALTLHLAPPQPLPAGQAVRVLVVPTLALPEREFKLRVIISQVGVGPALPILRLPPPTDNPSAAPEQVLGLEVSLRAGHAEVGGGAGPTATPLNIGCVEDFDRLQNAAGMGYLVVHSWGLRQGHLQVALPDMKAKKPPPVVVPADAAAAAAAKAPAK